MKDREAKKRVLIVDDEHAIRALLDRYLTAEGFEVHTATDGNEMIETMSRHAVDIILLDVRLPGKDGFSLLRDLRKTTSVPVLMLSERTEVFDRVAGLEAGADDYVPKPFELREVLARINAILRRDGRTDVQAENAPPTLAFAEFRLNLASRQLFDPDGREVPLTSMEFDILAALAKNPLRALDRDFLLEAAGDQAAAGDRTIDVHIGRLRKKIERDSAQPTLIKTIRGAGYIFSTKVERSH